MSSDDAGRPGRIGPTPAITFDADQTLWDFRGVMERALEATVVELERRRPELAGHVTTTELREARDRVAREHTGRPVGLEHIRWMSINVVLAAQGILDAALSRELTDFYLHLRFTDIRLYDDVRPALDRLRPDHRLGLLSNGNTYPDRCGLPGVFDAVVFGSDHGTEKPDVHLYTVIAELLDVAADRLVHVGDSYEDVLGANRFGAVSVFLDRDDTQPAWQHEARFTIRTLDELPAVLDQLDA